MNNRKCGCKIEETKKPVQKIEEKMKCGCETETIKKPEPKTDDCDCGCGK